MRFSSILPLLGVASLAQAFTRKSDQPTEYNGVEVPPLLNFNPETHDAALNSSSLVLIKYHSPYCPHCLDFIPTFQTAYEYYYTSQPEGTDKNFTEFYDFQFGAINCVAYYDLCQERGVKKYPTTMLYKDGVFFDKVRGRKNITLVTDMIEKGLEAAKPGSRPANFVPPEVVIREKDDPFASEPAPKEKNSEVPPAGGVAETDASDATTVKEKPQGDAPQQAAEEPQDSTAQSAEEPQNSAAQKPSGEKPQDSMAQSVEEKPQSDAAQQPAEEKVQDSTLEKTTEEPQVNAPATVVVQEVAKTTPTDYPVFPDPDVVLPVTPKSTATPNPKGESFSLTAESFQNHVTMTQDPWFIKFYAPWCSHCEALRPTWEQLGKDMKGRLNIGEVNCDQESRLCKDVRVSGYPTIILFKGAERVEYNGLRGLGDFKHFAESAAELTSGIPEVNAEEFAALEEKEPVIFTYFYDHAAATEDFMALERIPMNLIGRAKLVRTRDPDLYRRFKITTWPRLMVAREGRPTYYTPITPKDMRDIPAILKWMKSVWLPIVPELTAANAREIMDGKMVVLGILNREDQDAFASAQREMKSAANEWMDKQVQLFQLERQELRDAKQLRIEEAQDRDDSRALRQAKAIRINMDMSDKKQVTFAWVDGVFWQRWIRTTYGIDVKDGDRVIINDEDNRRYWDNTITGNNISPSRTSIMETISKVTAQPPKIKPKLTISGVEKVFFDFKMTSIEHPWLTLGCFSGIALAALSWFRGRLRRTRNNFGLEDAVGMKDMREGLLGGGSNGKVD